MSAKTSQLSFLSFLDNKSNKRNRSEILLLAETLRESHARKIEIIDFSCTPDKKRKKKKAYKS